jgi:hypothetical protein
MPAASAYVSADPASIAAQKSYCSGAPKNAPPDRESSHLDFSCDEWNSVSFSLVLFLARACMQSNILIGGLSQMAVRFTTGFLFDL